MLFSRFLSNESGATAIEYCLIAAGLSIVIVVCRQRCREHPHTRFASINSSLK